MLEFSQSRYVDPGARAELGKIAGAEVVVLGGLQRVDRTIRAHAHFVDVETGEVLHALRAEHALTDGDDAALFELQNKLSDEVRNAVPALLARARPRAPAP
jgi:TolB-like protein